MVRSLPTKATVYHVRSSSPVLHVRSSSPAGVRQPTPAVVAPVSVVSGILLPAQNPNNTRMRAAKILARQGPRKLVQIQFPKGDTRTVSKDLLFQHSGLFAELIMQADAQECMKNAQMGAQEGGIAQLSSLAHIERQIAQHSESQAASLQQALEGSFPSAACEVSNPTIEFYKQQAAAHIARAEKYDKAVESASKAEGEATEVGGPLEIQLDRDDGTFDEVLEWMRIMEGGGLGSQCVIETLKEKSDAELLRILVESDYYEMHELISQCQLVLGQKHYQKQQEKDQEWRIKWLENDKEKD